MPRNLEHIILSGYASTESYTSPNIGRDQVNPIPRDRRIHGNRLKDQIDLAITSFRQYTDIDFVYLEFI